MLILGKSVLLTAVKELSREEATRLAPYLVKIVEVWSANAPDSNGSAEEEERKKLARFGQLGAIMDKAEARLGDLFPTLAEAAQEIAAVFNEGKTGRRIAQAKSARGSRLGGQERK